MRQCEKLTNPCIQHTMLQPRKLIIVGLLLQTEDPSELE